MTIAFTCNCGKPIRVKDEYAARRVKCPACGQVQVVPGPAPGAPALLSAASAARADRWYYAANGCQNGPVSRAQLQELAASGRLAAGDLVWTETLPNWVPAGEVEGVFAAPPRLPVPPPLPPPPLPARAASNQEEIARIYRLITEIKTSASPAGGGQDSTFGAWYQRKLGHIPVLIQIIMWFFYGFIWIPVLYAVTRSDVSATPAADDRIQALEAQLRALDPSLPAARPGPEPTGRAGATGAFPTWTIWCYIPMINWVAWLHAALRSRYPLYYLYAVIYAIPFVLHLALSVDQDGQKVAPDWVMTLVMASWIAGIIHVSLKTKEVNLRIKYAAEWQNDSHAEVEQRIRAEYAAMRNSGRTQAPPDPGPPAGKQAGQALPEISTSGGATFTSVIMVWVKKAILAIIAAAAAWLTQYIVNHMLSKFFP